MIIPCKYQVFSEPIVLDGKDAERLAPYLSSWVKLHRFLLPGVGSPDLRRLVVLELIGARRRYILHRLLMRLGRVERLALAQRIERLL